MASAGRMVAGAIAVLLSVILAYIVDVFVGNFTFSMDVVETLVSYLPLGIILGGFVTAFMVARG